MPTPRTTPRSTPSASRFGRTTPPAGRLGRTPQAARRTPRTPRTTSSARLSMRRKPAPKSKSSQALNGLAGLIPGSVLGKAAKPSAGGAKGRAGKLALLAGVAGLAMKNRDKLPGPLGRKDTAEPLPAEPMAVTPDPVATTPPPAPASAPPAV